jgi:hypothetical protein
LAKAKHEKNREKVERSHKILANGKAGIEHLSDKLIEIKLKDEPNEKVTEDTMIKALH